MSEDEFERMWRKFKEIEQRITDFIEEEQRRIMRELEEVKRSVAPSWSYEGFLRPLSTIHDEGDEFVVYVDLPHVDRGSIDVKFYNNRIFIRARLKVKHRFSDWSGQGGRTEFNEYRDVITLPVRIDPESARVRFRKGVIEIRIKKACSS